MKRDVLTQLALTSTLLLSMACSSEETTKQEPTKGQQDTKELTAFVVEDNSTKTRTTAEYDGSGLNFYWTEGDRLWVNNGTLIQDASNNIDLKLENHPTIPSAVKRAATAKFYFNGTFTAPSYPVRYTGKGNTFGDKVTIKAQQNQNVANDASHIGEDGDCGTAVATKPAGGSKYNFTLDHKAAYLTFTPYNSQNAISAVHIAQIKVTADKAICGQFDFNDNGIDVDNSRPATTPANQSITLTLNGAAANTGFPIPGGSSDASKNAAVMVLAPGTYNTFTVEYLLRDNATNINKTIVKTYNNLTLNAGRNRRVITDLQVTDYSSWFDYYYMWDAVNPYWYGKNLPTVIENGGNYSSYGVPTASDGTNRWYNTAYSGAGLATQASVSCKDLPNVNEMYYYMVKGDLHYDGGSIWAFRGHLYWGGAWIKKQKVIYNELKAKGYTQLTSQSDMKEKFYSSATDATGIDFRVNSLYVNTGNSIGRPSDTSDYFYLPALGYFLSGSLYNMSYGFYWTSTGVPNAGGNAYKFSFYAGQMNIYNSNTRAYGFIAHTFE